ncbi:MAG: diacylglycerol kinase family protein [Oscillospiraceae bacterium]|jgi:diacylglycerol kinase|nr:diacylglycerol kinase family protein [Oscillospiraceae bacterium]
MRSFKYAFQGLVFCIRTERNMRIHLCFCFYVICTGVIVRLTAAQWAAAFICMGFVMALECLNTALETLCDTVHPEKHAGIKIAKDASAAAVLCAAIGAAAVGIAIFFASGHWRTALDFATEQPVITIALVLTAIPAAWFVFYYGRTDTKEKK